MRLFSMTFLPYIAHFGVYQKGVIFWPLISYFARLFRAFEYMPHTTYGNFDRGHSFDEAHSFDQGHGFDQDLPQYSSDTGGGYQNGQYDRTGQGQYDGTGQGTGQYGSGNNAGHDTIGHEW